MNSDSASSWRKLARLADAPLGGIGCIEVDGVTVLLCRSEAGVYALADRCSHAGQPLREGRIRGDTLICPFHGARFRLRDGTPAGGPARHPIRSYRLRIDGEDILIQIES